MSEAVGSAITRLTDISLPSSRADWRTIKRRAEPKAGTRQENFTPTEVVLCMAAMLLVNHRKFGGSTSHLAPSPVPELAQLFKRPPSSILAKMANLDGSRPHGGRAEKEAAAALLQAGATGLCSNYLTILAAAREEHIDQVALPDFLGLNDSPFVMLGQEEISDVEVERAVAGRVSGFVAGSGLSASVVEKLLVAVARVGQHVFTWDVLANFAHQCVFCGLAPGRELENFGLLRVSHIKPWSDSADRERVDIRNGISACPDHGVAFRSGLLYLADDLEICASQVLMDRIGESNGIGDAFAQPRVKRHLLLPREALLPREKFIWWHRENVAIR